MYYNIKNEATNSFTKTNPVWLRKGDHGDHWQYGQVFYEGGNKSVYNFVFEGRASSSFFSGKLKFFSLN